MRAKLLFLFLLLYSFSEAQNDSINTIKFEKYTNQAYQHMYTNQDSAYYYFNKALELSEEQNWYYNKASILSYIIYVSDYHYNLPVLKSNLNSLETLLVKKKDSIRTEDYDELLPLFLLNKGNYYFKLEDYKRAKPLFLKLYNTLKSKTDSKENITNLNSVYSFLTNIYTSEGKYNSAINFHDKAVLIQNNYFNYFDDIESNRMLFKSYMAKIYNSQKQYKKGIKLLEEIVTFYKQRNYKNSLITSYQALINAYILSKNTEKALKLLSSSEKIYRENDPFYKILLELYGDVYTQKASYTDALTYYTKSLNLYKTYRNNEKHLDIALINQKIADTYYRNKQYEKALETINEALYNLTFFDEKNASKLSVEKILTNDQTINILHLKSKILTRLFEKSNENKYLKEALETSLFTTEVLDNIKPTLENKNDKQFLINNVYPIFETALNECFLLYNSTQDSQYLEKAFFILEKSKSTQLLEVVNLTKAVNFNNIPQELIDKEQQLLAAISNIETDIYVSKTSTEKQQQLITAREKYNTFIDSVKIKQPKYHNLKYNYNVSSLSTIKKTITNNDGRLSFFYGKDYIYQFIITSNKVELLRFKNDTDFQDELLDFYETVSNFKSKYDNQKANVLYTRLIPESLRNKTDLIILPDGFLYYIPFEALSTSSSETNYVVNSTAISYGNSFTLLEEINNLESSKNIKNKILAVAPEFYNTKSTEVRADFSPLIFNKKEVKNIATYFDTDTIIGKNAILENIQDKLTNYQILHFATHASANDEYPDFSYLAFTPTENQSNLWYIKDIYNTKLNADLVALSACQTGIGKVENGEGSISLARAFSYAGAKSLVKSLWKVNDRSSSEIMSLFYGKLNKGTNKKKALQSAKKEYLEQSVTELQHPFFWAGFILNGNTKPVTNSYNYIWFLFIGIPLGFAFVFRKKLFNFFK